MDHLNELTQTPKLALIKTRILAALIDAAIYFGIGYGIAAAFGMTFQTEGGFGFNLTGGPAILFFFVWVILTPVNEGLTGQTIGKRVTGIQVVKQDHSPTSIGTSLARHLLDVLDVILLVGIIIAASNSNKQRIGDLVAKTIVVIK